MKRFLLLAGLLGLAVAAGAQKVLSIEDAVTYKNGALLPKSLNGLAWIPESHTYYHLAKKDSINCYVFVDADKRTRDTLTLAEINMGIKQYNGITRPQTPLAELSGVPGILSRTRCRAVMRPSPT